MILQIAQGLQELQNLDIIHGDIKPQNILLDKNRNAFIADFGTSRMTTFDHTLVSNTLQATLRFAPPEMIFDKIINQKVILV